MTNHRFLSIDNIKLFIFGLTLQLISRGSSLFSFTFNIDDIMFWPVQYNYTNLAHLGLLDGRFIFPILAGIAGLLGINPPLAFTISTLSFMVCITIASIAVCYIWRIQQNRIACLIVIGFITLHPYSTDFYTWRIATFWGGLPFVFTGFILLLGTRSYKAMMISIIIFSLSLGIHQIPLEFYGATLGCSALLIYLRYLGVIIDNDYMATDFKVEAIHLLRMVLILAIGALIYVVIAKIYIIYGGKETLSRDKLIFFDKPYLVLSRISELFLLFSVKDPLITYFSRVLFIGLLLVPIFAILRKKILFFSKVKAFLALFGCLLVVVLSSIALTIVPIAWVPVFRNLFSISLLWSVIAVIAYLTVKNVFSKFVLILIGLLFVAFTAKNNEMLTDQMRVNSRDISMMNRIVSDIEKLPEFKKLNSLAFIGTTPKSLHGLKSGADLSNGWNSYGTTLSLFAIPWNGYLTSFFNEVTGYQLSTVMDLVTLKNTCTNLSWPQVGSVFSIDLVAVVCLGGNSEINYGPLDGRH